MHLGGDKVGIHGGLRNLPIHIELKNKNEVVGRQYPVPKEGNSDFNQ
jgi:hypothetical protein